MDNRRRHRRYAAEVLAEVDVGNDTLIGETRDISEGGVSVHLEQVLEEGRELGLVLVLTEEGVEKPDQEPLEVKAAVMWSAPTDDGRAMMGLRFLTLSTEQQEQLQRFLSAL